MGKFSDIAYNKMIELSSDTKNKVGRELFKAEPIKYKDHTRTDCTTFVLNVLKHAFKETAQVPLSNSLTSYKAQRGKDTKPKWYGDLMFNSLVNKHGWKAIYLTPDKFHPNDGDKEHTAATDQVIRTCKYATIPVTYTVMNYNPTPKTHPEYTKLLQYLGEQKLNATDLSVLSKIKFGVGMSRKGMHNWLFSYGSVYEVHWENVGKDLYEIRKLANFPWNSSLLIVPPDAIPLLKMSSIKCP